MKELSFFVTGTGTDVGKTQGSILLGGYISKYLENSFYYLKPIQTGSKISRDDRQVLKYLPDGKVETLYSYKEPLSPHLAMFREGKSISYDEMVIQVKDRLCQNPYIVVEGAGGVRVPIDESKEMIDLIGDISIPVVLVCSCALGTLNHTLLTVEAFFKRGIKIKLILFNLHDDTQEYLKEDNYRMLKKKIEIPIIKIPFFSSLDEGVVHEFYRQLECVLNE